MHLNNIHRMQMEYMSRLTTSTVYAAELRGIVLGLQIMLNFYAIMNTAGKCFVFIDNQAAIQATANPKCLLRQYILIEVICALDQL
jgi:hypothetical protein